MERAEIEHALEEAFDQALVFHGFADLMRDYDVYIYAPSAPSSAVPPEHLRYRFTHCVRATVTTGIRAEVWARSLDERLTDFETFKRTDDLEGFVWGVKWQDLYPGISLLPASQETERWSTALGMPFHEVQIETNVHVISLIFADLIVSTVEPGHAAFVVPGK